jgi:hypothetical protein
MSAPTVPIGAAAPIAQMTKKAAGSSSGLIFAIIVLGLVVVYLLVRVRKVDKQISTITNQRSDTLNATDVNGIVHQYVGNPENRHHLLRNILPYLPTPMQKSTKPKNPSGSSAAGPKKPQGPKHPRPGWDPMSSGMPQFMDAGFLLPHLLGVPGGGSQILFQSTMEDEETAASGFAPPPTTTSAAVTPPKGAIITEESPQVPEKPAAPAEPKSEPKIEAKIEFHKQEEKLAPIPEDSVPKK